jgi:hypothetical protein
MLIQPFKVVLDAELELFHLFGDHVRRFPLLGEHPGRRANWGSGTSRGHCDRRIKSCTARMYRESFDYELDREDRVRKARW